MVDKDLLVCFLKLRNLDDFKPFRQWIDTEFDNTLKVLTGSQEDRAMYQAQGAARLLQRMKDLIEGADSALDKRRG